MFTNPYIDAIENYSHSIKQYLKFNDIFSWKISKLKNGKIYVGGRYSSQNGYFSFCPDSIKKNNFIPPVVITDFKIKNRSVPLDLNIMRIFSRLTLLHLITNILKTINMHTF